MTNQELKKIEERCKKAFIGYNGPFASSIDEVDEFFTDSLKIIPALLADLEDKNNELMALYSKRESPLEKFNEFIEDEKDPVERLRFYLSLALTGQDWLDVESFFNDIIKERKDLEDKNRWIPVEERLPEKEGIYLVFEPWVYGVNALWFVLSMNGLPTPNTKKEWETVSHWKSLPKGPEE